MEQRIIKRSNDIIQQVRDLPTDNELLASTLKRKDLASLYRQIMVMGANYPPAPIGMKAIIPAQLQKRISESCGNCVRSAAMKSYISTAKVSLNSYASVLDAFLEGKELGGYEESIHNLRPTD